MDWVKVKETIHELETSGQLIIAEDSRNGSARVLITDDKSSRKSISFNHIKVDQVIDAIKEVSLHPENYLFLQIFKKYTGKTVHPSNLNMYEIYDIRRIDNISIDEEILQPDNFRDFACERVYQIILKIKNQDRTRSTLLYHNTAENIALFKEALEKIGRYDLLLKIYDI